MVEGVGLFTGESAALARGQAYYTGSGGKDDEPAYILLVIRGLDLSPVNLIGVGLA